MDREQALLQVIKKFSETTEDKLGKKMLQKLVYLLERKNVDIGFAYSIHYYGPYSSSLDYCVHSLHMQGLINIVPEQLTHQIRITENSPQSEEFSPQQLQTLQYIIDKFGKMSASRLELLTTTDFVAQNLRQNKSNYSDASIIQGVQTLKGEKFSLALIEEAISILRQEEYIQ